jgi:hypothetical protein
MGTLTTNIVGAIAELKQGRVEFRMDRTGNVHAPIGKAYFEQQALFDNVGAFTGAGGGVTYCGTTPQKDVHSVCAVLGEGSQATKQPYCEHDMMPAQHCQPLHIHQLQLGA